MKRYQLEPSEYSYSLPDDKVMHRVNAKQVKVSFPRGRRNSHATIKAKALLRRLGL